MISPRPEAESCNKSTTDMGLLCRAVALLLPAVGTAVVLPVRRLPTHARAAPRVSTASLSEATRDPEATRDFAPPHGLEQDEATRDLASPAGTRGGTNHTQGTKQAIQNAESLAQYLAKRGALPPTSSVPDSVRSEADADPMEAYRRFRERQRQQAAGIPMREWSKLADIEDNRPDHVPVPPTPEQQAAANALFQSMMKGSAPAAYTRTGRNAYQRHSEFGEGLESLADEDSAPPPPPIKEN